MSKRFRKVTIYFSRISPFLCPKWKLHLEIAISICYYEHIVSVWFNVPFFCHLKLQIYKSLQTSVSDFRYELPGVNGFNFCLKNALGGGGVASLRSDPQVKSHCNRCSLY